MTQRRVRNDYTALRHYLRNAGEVGLRSYVEMLMGALRQRASQTASHIDDVIVIALEVLVARVFPAQQPDPPATTEE